MINFTYDRRNRLIEEERTGTQPYRIAYTYDLAGNRLTKTEGVGSENGGPVTTYTYDVDAPSVYGSQGNRMVHSQRSWNFLPNSTLDSYYLYDKAGRVTRVGWKVAGDVDVNGQWYHGVDLYYNSAGLIWIARSMKWQLQEVNNVMTAINEVGLSAMEYRYDSARGRYRTQRRDPRKKLANGSSNVGHFLFPYNPALADGPCWSVPAEGVWSDYDGDSIEGDYTLSIAGSPPSQTATAFNTTGHEPGLGQFDWNGAQPPSTVNVQHTHDNLIGTNEAMTDSAGAVTRRTVFTAFGEPVYENGSTDSRYGYAGSWGYQEAGSGDPLAELGWMHVGYRYYDPSSGRFVQRDPMGIEGGLNTYVYVGNAPTIFLDPLGLDIFADLDAFLDCLFSTRGATVGGSLLSAMGYANMKYHWGIGAINNRLGAIWAGATLGWNLGKLINQGTGLSNGIGWILGEAGVGRALNIAADAVKSALIPDPYSSFSLQYPRWPGMPQGVPRNPLTGGDICNRCHPKNVCFDGATLVWTVSGLKRIDDVTNSDAVVMCVHGQSGARFNSYKVSEIETHSGVFVMYELIVANETIMASEGHCFLVSGCGWTPIEEIQPGDTLFSVARQARVTAIRKVGLSGPVQVYNVKVSSIDRYMIGMAGILVRDH